MADRITARERLNQLLGASDTDLDAAVLAGRKAIYQFHKDRLSKPIENVKVVRAARKDVARALTIKRQRELAEQPGSDRQV